jgi:hypothetical protein
MNNRVQLSSLQFLWCPVAFLSCPTHNSNDLPETIAISTTTTTRTCLVLLLVRTRFYTFKILFFSPPPAMKEMRLPYKVAQHVAWTVGASTFVWLVCRLTADAETWQAWHQQMDAYDFLTSPRAALYGSRWLASLAYALAWWFPRTMCVVHAFNRGMWQVGALTVLVEPFSMLGVHYLLAWFFHLATAASSSNPNRLHWLYRCLLLFTKARAWMRRAPPLSDAPYIWQQRDAFAFWHWKWLHLARNTLLIFVLHLVLGPALTWWHLIDTLWGQELRAAFRTTFSPF